MEYKLKTFLYICFLILINSSNTWDFNKGGADWLNDCKGENQSPIDISQPFMYKKLEMIFTYANMNTEYLFYNDGNNLIIEGDFGYINYNDKYYFSSQIIFYSSSMHTFSNKKLPLEMQIIHKDADGNNLIIVIMFKYTKDDYSSLLGKIGFDNEKLKNQLPYTPIKLKEDINLSKYLSEDKDFFMYEGLEALPPCKSSTTYLILSDVLKVSERQLENFPEIIKNKNKIVQNRGDRIIYTSFKLEDLQEKKKEADEKLEEMEKEKKAFEKAEKIEEKMEDKLEKLEANITLEQISQELNKLNNFTTDNSTINKNISISNTTNSTISNNTSSTNNSDCENQRIIPFEKIKQQIKSIEELTKVNDPKFLVSFEKDENEIEIIKDLPDTQAEENKKLLEKQFNEWKDLYETTKNSESITPQNFLQMKILEKDLKQNKYEPYLNEFSYNDIGYTSFIQLRSSDETLFDSEVIIKNKYEKLLEDKEVKDKINELTNMILGLEHNDVIVSCNVPINKTENSLSEYNKTSNNFLSISVKEIENNTIIEIPQINVNTNNDSLSNVISSSINSTLVNENDSIINNNEYIQYNPNPNKQNDILENNLYYKSEQINDQLENYNKMKNLIHNNFNNSNIDLNTYLKLRNNSNDSNIVNSIEDPNLKNYLILKNKIIDSFNKTDQNQSINISSSNQSILINNSVDNSQISNFLEQSIQINEINDDILQDIKVDTINDKLNQNFLKFEKLKGIVDVLDKTYEVKKEKLIDQQLLTNNTIVEPEIIMKSTNLFDTNIDYDINVFNIIKITINELAKDYIEIDKINSKNNIPSLVDEQGNIIFTLENLANAIKASFNINENESQLKIEDKLNKLEKIITDLLVTQNNFHITNEITPEEINTVISNINNNDQYQLKSLSDQNKLKKLIFVILKELPIKLAIKENEINIEFDPDDIFITEENAKKLSKAKDTVYGPNAENLSPIGQGRKAVSKAGTVENIEIFNTETWPNTCKSDFQSPININIPYEAEENGLKINLIPVNKFKILNDGYKLYLTTESFGTITHGDHVYVAKEIHIHHYSEHTFGDDEKRSALEMQLICYDMFGNIAAVSVHFDLGEDNELLYSIGFGIDNPIAALKIRNMETYESDKTFDMGKYINKVDHFFSYVGSLTTPPCKENVKWFILLTKLKISQKQLDYFPILFGRNTNVRGLQNLNGRKISII